MVHTSLRTLLDTTHSIATEIVAVDAPDVDREARWPERGIRALQAAGLGGLVVPESVGGLGQGLFALAQIGEILGRVCPSTALCFGMHTVGAAVIAAKATPEQQQVYLDPINRGTHLTTLTLSEPGTGSHFYFPQTVLRGESPTHFRVTGKKSFTTNGGYADSYVVSTVATGPEVPLGEFSCVMVREGAAGMVWGPAWAGLGMRGNSSRSLELRDVLVPRADLLGAEGEQIWYIFNIVAPYFLIAMAGTYLGIAAAALAEAQAHMKQRTYSHSGTGLGHVSVLQHRLGTLWGMVERTRRLVYFAALEADSGGPDTLPALCTAKAEVAECAVTVVNEVMTLMGGITYRGGSRVERMLRDARAAHVMAPTTDILRTWAGRALLGHPLLGD